TQRTANMGISSQVHGIAWSLSYSDSRSSHGDEEDDEPHSDKVVTLSLSLALPWLLQDRITAMAVIGLMMALWVLIFALMEVHERATHRHGFWRGLRTLTRSQWGMVLGH
ncbi:cytochrome c-type biogenesis CcmF C-terminal domain-containing protein, partial [Escherichia coli]|uniref:cytochrome c-type biogenesis CcmF C-terminal domain-containing protein n=1 Tax=Escherichia coli TaxID=562 RepID=UPI0024DFFB94